MIWVQLPHAFAVFSGQRRSGSPSMPLTANAYATTNALFFTQGRYYVEIVADRASETLQNSLETYATALLAKLPAEGETKDAPKRSFPRRAWPRTPCASAPPTPLAWRV